MLNLNKHIKIKPKPKQALKFKNCTNVHIIIFTQLSYRTQHRTVLIVFPLIPQTVTTAQMLMGGKYILLYKSCKLNQ